MRRVLITGGSGGIGSAIARTCAAHGIWPIVGYARNQDGALDTIAKCGTGETLHLDLLADTWNLDAARDASAVVHCAGLYSRQRTLLGSDRQELSNLLEVNALAPLRLTEALIAGGAPLSHSITLLSTAMSCRGGGPYALSKAAALAGCKLLAGELEPKGVRIHAIVPGWTETPMAELAAAVSGRTLDEVRAGHPHRNLLKPEDLAQLVLDLLLDVGHHEEGQLISWDLRDSDVPVWADLKNALST